MSDELTQRLRITARPLFDITPHGVGADLFKAADRIDELEEALEGVVEMLFEVGGCDKSVVDLQAIISKGKDI